MLHKLNEMNYKQAAVDIIFLNSFESSISNVQWVTPNVHTPRGKTLKHLLLPYHRHWKNLWAGINMAERLGNSCLESGSRYSEFIIRLR